MSVNTIGSVIPPIETVIWLALLWYVSGLIATRDSAEPADRLRDSIFVGVSVAFSLAFAHVFYKPVCFSVVLIAAAYRYVRAKGTFRHNNADTSRFRHRRLAYAIPSGAVVTVGWSGVVRPLLEGDSLAYHLPNAAAWAGDHSFWTTTTTYWWYPPASELFASALLVIGGPSVVSIAGFVATLLLSLRLVAFAERANIVGWKAGALSAAIVTLPTIALQTSSLQNDVWLAAWVLESIWAALYDRGAVIRSLAICMLLKPVGIVCALLVALLTRSRPVVVLAAGLPYLVWLMHDALLWRYAVVPPAQTAYPHIVGTTIIAQGTTGIITLLEALWAQGSGIFILAAMIPLAIVYAPESVRRHFPWVMSVAFLVEPFAYKNPIPQLSNGSSLRFLLPSLVTGIVGVLQPLSRATLATAVIAAAFAIFQLRTILQIFWNDANAHGAVPFGIGAALILVLLPSRSTTSLVMTCCFAASLAYAVRLDNYPPRYYDAWLGNETRPTRLFDWLSQAKPTAAVAWRLRSGAISIVSPGSKVEDAALSDPCRQARIRGAVLIFADDERDSVFQRVEEKKLARACGHVVFEDAAAIVVVPSTSST